jgi:hypothetical protein
LAPGPTLPGFNILPNQQLWNGRHFVMTTSSVGKHTLPIWIANAFLRAAADPRLLTRFDGNAGQWRIAAVRSAWSTSLSAAHDAAAVGLTSRQFFPTQLIHGGKSPGAPCASCMAGTYMVARLARRRAPPAERIVSLFGNSRRCSGRWGPPSVVGLRIPAPLGAPAAFLKPHPSAEGLWFPLLHLMKTYAVPSGDARGILEGCRG